MIELDIKKYKNGDLGYYSKVIKRLHREDGPAYLETYGNVEYWTFGCRIG